METIEIVKKLQSILPAQAFILAGSNAIKLHGIPCATNPKDIDILLYLPSTGAFNNLERFQSSDPNPKFLNTQNPGSIDYSFFYEGVQVDVWLIKTLEEYYLEYEGVKINPISQIVDAKKRQNRSKDFVQRQQWANTIFNPDTDRVENVRTSEEYRSNDAPEKKIDPVTDEWNFGEEEDLPF